MSTFEVKVYKLEIQPHPNADNIELAKVGDYISIVRKGDFKTGDLGVYIPEQALVPQRFLKAMGLEGKLSGKDKNRVKAIRLRGVLSQGLVYPVKPTDIPGPMPYMIEIWKPDEPGITSESWYVNEGEDIAALLGITKWEPPLETIPQQMRGRTVGVALNITVNYDVENVKKYNQVFQEGELVSITEKIHGTFVQFGYIPRRLFEPYLHLGCYTVTSKGLGGRGVLLDFADANNVYARTAQDPRYGIGYKIVCIKAEYQELIGDNPVYICGEIFGPGIQKGYGYGLASGEVGFRMFDIAYGERGNLKYIRSSQVWKIAKDYEIPMVPVLHAGPFSKEILAQCTSGRETVSGRAVHIREGCVVKPFEERYDPKAGRASLKSVSDAYLLQDNTEFQ